MTLSNQPMNPRSSLAMTDIRLAIVSDAAPERNGVGAYYEDLLGYLAPRVEKAEIFSPTIEEGVWKAGLVLPMPGDTTQKLCFPNFWTLQRDLARLNPHVVIIPTPGVYGMTGAFLAALRDIPVLAGFHTSFEQLSELYWHGSLTGRVFSQYVDKTHRYLIKVAAGVLVNSTDIADVASDLGATEIIRIGTPIPRLFAQYPITAYAGALTRVLFAGRLAAEKNIASIIAAAEALPEIHFSIAGDGPERDDVSAAAARLPNLEYLGWLSREALRDQVDAHDCLILPSHFETFGTIALEAMSRGRLVIVSRQSGIADWPELSCGFLTMDDDDLEATLRRASLMTVPERQQIAEAGMMVARKFNDENLQGWEDLLVDIVNR